MVEKEEELRKETVNIASKKDDRRRFVTLAQDRKHSATSEVLAVRDKMKHCR